MRTESDSEGASLSVHTDDSVGLYLALCAFECSLRDQIPTAVATAVHASKVESWATALRVSVHDSDLEDARLLAHSCGVGGHACFSVDSRLQPSACFVSPEYSVVDANKSDDSRWWCAEHELLRVMNIVDSSRCELIYVEGGAWAGTFGAHRPGCASAATCEPASPTDASELLGADPCTSAAPPFPALPSPGRSPSGSPPLRELWVGVPRAMLPRMLRKFGVLVGLLPGAPVRLFELFEEPLIKHLPLDAGMGRLRFDAGTAMVADGASFLRTSTAHTEGASATGARFPKQTVVEDAALMPPTQIAAGATRCCSMGALLLIGAGDTSTVVALGSAHYLRLRDIGAVTLEDTTLDAVSAARDGVSLTALACVNPGLCATDPTPFGTYVHSRRAEPCAAPDEPPEPVANAIDCFQIVADVAVYGLPSGPDDPPHGAADMVPLPHLACELPVRLLGTTCPVPCLPPFAAYSGIVLVTGINVVAGPGQRKLRVIGYAVKTLRVPNPAARPHEQAWMLAKVVTYFAAPAGGIAPHEGDSGGGVYQLSGTGSFVLHSFVSARAVMTDPVTGVTAEFYTLTPAHLALEQVRSLQGAPGSALPQGALSFVHPK